MLLLPIKLDSESGSRARRTRRCGAQSSSLLSSPSFTPTQPIMSLNADLISQLSAQHAPAAVTYVYGTAGFRTKQVHSPHSDPLISPTWRGLANEPHSTGLTCLTVCCTVSDCWQLSGAASWTAR